ncbi:alpha/beta hydrolase [Thalassoroseus pseudoceratinae]|uniref:alpha/beta hydrolase n=1 Tax=Thalassoroseus pseudoceratinae TaxID=2713176 RepID=UPI0014233E74|nr:alpha/beta hydrolase-fold protein [Thalassoroseus pseudoceratinae]
MNSRFSDQFWLHHSMEADATDASVPAPQFWEALRPVGETPRPSTPTFDSTVAEDCLGLADELNTDDGPCRCVVRNLHPRRRPTGLFLPEHYEANYAYPLVLWLHGEGGTEFEMFSAISGISTRNYIGLSLRAPEKSESGGYCWDRSPDGLAKLESDIYATVCQLRRVFNVHSERVILAGFDSGATTAMQLILRRPDWYGGVVSMCGNLPTLAELQDQIGLEGSETERRRALFIAGDADEECSAMDVLNAKRSLQGTPLDVSIAIESAGHEVTRPMLRNIDHWIMNGLYATV